MSNFWGGRRFSSFKKKRLSLGGGGGNDENQSMGGGGAQEFAKRKLHKVASKKKSSTMVEMDSGTIRSMKSLSLMTDDELQGPEPLGPQLPTTMPEKAELDELFESVLAEMAVKEGHRQAFSAMPDQKKWEMIVMHYKKKQKPVLKPKAQTSFHVDVKSAEYWIGRMKERNGDGAPCLSPSDARQFQAVLRASDLEFLKEFMELLGVKALNDLTSYYADLSRKTDDEHMVLDALIECYKHLMNGEVGMQGVLTLPSSIRTITRCMDFNATNHSLTEKIVTLLSVACWWDEDGRRNFMEGMRDLKSRYREFAMFYNIVYLFEKTEIPKFKASLATFITTVCNSAPTTEKRIKVRNLFYRHDIIRIFERVLESTPKEFDSVEDEGYWMAVKTQYEVFVAMMREDQKEVVHRMIQAADEDGNHLDLSNLGESWKIVQKNMLNANCGDQLLNVVQALFLVPTVEPLAAPILESIAKFIFEATSLEAMVGSGKPGTPPEMNFEELGKIVKLKIEYDAKLKTFTERDGLVLRQQKLIRVLQKRLAAVQSGKIAAADATNLEEVLMTADMVSTMKASSGLSKPSSQRVDLSLLAGLGLADTSNEIEIMKERESKLKSEIDSLQKQVAALSKGGAVPPPDASTAPVDNNDPIKAYKGKLDSTGLVPAGIAPGKTLKEPPAPPKAGMPGSLENAPVAVAAPQAAEENADGPKKGGLEAMLMGRLGGMKAKPKNNKNEKRLEALKKLGLPDKQQMKPKIKMTQLFWNVIDPEALEGTIWPELSDQNIVYSPEELEDLFGKVSKEGKKKKAKTKSDKEEVVKLIESNRRQNVGIALKNIKMSNEEIYQAIIKTDLAVLNVELVQVMLDTVPTSDELTLLTKYEKDGGKSDKLANEEQYLLKLTQIPNVSARLNCIKTTDTFKHSAKKIYSVILKVKKAMKEINSSGDLRKIMEIVLAIGNYLNGGSARGAAWGYKLDILQNLSNVKDNANNGTLMHYLYALLERNYPDLVNFSLSASAQVVDISLREVFAEMNGIAKEISVLKQEIKKKPFSPKDMFRSVLTPFEVKASKDVEKLQQQLETIRGDFQNLALKFAESGDDLEPKTFFPKFVNFEQNLKKAGSEIAQLKAEEEKKKVAEEKKKERQTYMKFKKLVEATKDTEGNLDMGIIQAFKASQEGDAAHVIDKFMQKYRRDLERQKKRKLKKSPPRPRTQY